VRIDPDFAALSRPDRPQVANMMLTPGQLFADYCASEQVQDARVAALFGQLHDEVTAAGGVG
jgi:hypothetical protein